MSGKNDAKLALEYVPIELLHPNPHNPRKGGVRQMRAHRLAIDTFGANVPILLDTTNVILAGEAYFLAAKQRGMTEVPCVRLSQIERSQRTIATGRPVATTDENRTRPRTHGDAE